MKLTEDQKNAVYQQITDFNKHPSDPSRSNSDPFGEAYYYVDDSNAEICAIFFKHCLDKEGLSISQPISTIDLCFGSGNLTSHLLLESDMELGVVVLNDRNTEKTNQMIKETDLKPDVMRLDILSDEFDSDKKPFGLVVFNPQMGGSYTDGNLQNQLDATDCNKIVVGIDNIESWMRTEYSLDEAKIPEIKVDDSARTITVTYKVKKEVEKIKAASINYYDIILVKEEADAEHKSQCLSQLRKNIDAVAADDHVIVFHGKEEHFQLFFKDYRWVRQLESPSLFIARRGGEEQDWKRFQEKDGSFIEVNEDKNQVSSASADKSLSEIQVALDGEFGLLTSLANENPLSLGGESTTDSDKKKPTSVIVSWEELGNRDFEIKNLLLKGVPGTGKSYLIDRIIEEKLGLDPHDAEHVLRINIHSASSNADLMQGIGLTTRDNQIEYREKQGLIYDMLCRACAAPQQPFVLVLEEIQENSLNELIGDLIYLIEPDKRAKIGEIKLPQGYSSLEEIMEVYIEKSNGSMKYVRIPNLVEAGTVYRKLIFPDNLYVFCTSNYRDDKKIIEDNLLRRFVVLDVFPNPNLIVDAEIRKLFSALNEAILNQLKDEVHPDRFEVGHAIWMNVKNDELSIARALYKTLIELKEIREIQTADIVAILKQVKNSGNNLSSEIQGILNQFNGTDLISFIKGLQVKAYPNVLKLLASNAGSQKAETLQDDDGQD